VARSNEPLFWSLFSAGGAVAAFFGPVMIALIGFGGPLGLLPADRGLAFDRLRVLVSPPIARVVLFVIIVAPMFHWAHRFRFVLADVGLRRLKKPIAVVCYGVAILVTIATALVLLKL
jgi:succinate dehydrogenase subunit D